MDARFVPIYDELALDFDPTFRLRARRSRAVYAQADRWSFEVVNAVARDYGGKKRLRADARLFLISNLALMVARPLLHPRAPQPDEKEVGRLQDVMFRDARMVFDRAQEDKGGEVSAAAVVRALAVSLEDLELKEWRLWDRYEERSRG